MVRALVDELRTARCARYTHDLLAKDSNPPEEGEAHANAGPDRGCGCGSQRHR